MFPSDQQTLAENETQETAAKSDVTLTVAAAQDWIRIRIERWPKNLQRKPGIKIDFRVKSRRPVYQYSKAAKLASG